MSQYLCQAACLGRYLVTCLDHRHKQQGITYLYVPRSLENDYYSCFVLIYTLHLVIRLISEGIPVAFMSFIHGWSGCSVVVPG